MKRPLPLPIALLAVPLVLWGCGGSDSPPDPDTGQPVDPGTMDSGPLDPGTEPYDPGTGADDPGGPPDPDPGKDMGDMDPGPGDAVDTDDSVDAPVPVEPGAVIFTEILQNPPGGTDKDLEAVELYNTTAQALDINGWVLSDKDKDHHVIDAGGPLLIQPQGYLVLSRTEVWVTEGVAAYAYSGFVLSNTEDEAILSTADRLVVDQVAYAVGGTFPEPDGATMQLDPAANDHEKNDHGVNWCLSTKVQPAPKAPKLSATLGKANDDCSDCPDTCGDRECGCDECGNPCGGCPFGFGCTDEGKCVEMDAGCVPSTDETGCAGCACENCVCGIDPWCCDTAWDFLCVELCEAECAGPACSDTCLSMDCFLFDRECGPDGCCGSCGTCQSGSYCHEPEYQCTPCTCDGKDCGNDGCGIQCGQCTGDDTCYQDLCMPPGCAPTEEPGCDACPCRECACAIDPYCCSDFWDTICVGICKDDCGQVCPGQETR